MYRTDQPISTTECSQTDGYLHWLRTDDDGIVRATVHVSDDYYSCVKLPSSDYEYSGVYDTDYQGIS